MTGVAEGSDGKTWHQSKGIEILSIWSIDFSTYISLDCSEKCFLVICDFYFIFFHDSASNPRNVFKVKFCSNQINLVKSLSEPNQLKLVSSLVENWVHRTIEKKILGHEMFGRQVHVCFGFLSAFIIFLGKHPQSDLYNLK